MAQSKIPYDNDFDTREGSMDNEINTREIEALHFFERIKVNSNITCWLKVFVAVVSVALIAIILFISIREGMGRGTGSQRTNDDTEVQLEWNGNNSEEIEQKSCGCFQEENFVEFAEKVSRMEMKLEQLQKQIDGKACENECPDGWVAFQESCYLFWNYTSISFAKAAEVCEQNGARVVFVETAEENNFLKNYIRAMKAVDQVIKKEASWWIGMTDQETEGVWKWYGTNNVVTFTDWLRGEPNGGRRENCCHFYSRHDYQWNDFECNLEKVQTNYAICEKKKCKQSE